jgi:hypothetical protein
MIETRLFAVLVSTSTSMTSTESRPIDFNSRIGHKRTRFVLQESLFNKKIQNVLPLCLLSSNSSTIDDQISAGKY